MKEYLNKVGDECIHCSACTKKCLFLTKYKMDLGEFAKYDVKSGGWEEI